MNTQHYVIGNFSKQGLNFSDTISSIEASKVIILVDVSGGKQPFA